MVQVYCQAQRSKFPAGGGIFFFQRTNSGQKVELVRFADQRIYFYIKDVYAELIHF